MGEVRAKVRITNAADEVMAQRGFVKPSEIRSVELEAMVDTGAVRCVMPIKVMHALGLRSAARRRAQHADGRSEEVDVTEPVRRKVSTGFLPEFLISKWIVFLS